MTTSEKRNHYVYRSYEPLGREYIGSRSCDCPVEEDPYMGSYSDPTFFPTQKEILAVCHSKEEKLITEMFFHEMYDVARNPRFANKAKQTSTGFSREGVPHREETLREMRETRSGENHPLFGKPRSEETKRKISEACSNPSEETRKKLSEAMTGKNSGKPRSEETRRKISEALSNPSEGTLRKMSEAKKGEKHPQFGKKWWVNEFGDSVCQKDCPGSEWQQRRKWKPE